MSPQRSVLGGSSTEDSSADTDLLHEQFLGGPFPLTQNSSGVIPVEQFI